MFTGEQIREKRKKEGLSVDELAEKLKVPVQSLYKWEKGTRPNNPEHYTKLERWLEKGLESVPEALETEPKNGHSVSGIANTSQLLETINLLVRQNDKLAETNRILAEKITTIPVGADSEIQRSVDTMLQGLREFVLKLSVGTRYKSLDEARSAYRKELGDVLGKSKVKGIQHS